MDCSICSPVSHILRPPRNSICQACYDGAKSMIAFLNKQEPNGDVDNKCNISDPPQSNSSKGIGNALKWVKEMKEREEGLNEKLSFLSGLVAVFKYGTHADIQVKAGNGSSILAHRALLAARSDILKNMLETDGCKAPPANETISLPELNHEELESLLEFLYSGSLPKEKLDKHVYSLSVAADKYEIHFLQKFCENRMLDSFDSSNALNVLEISDVCSNTKLKEASMDFIIKHTEEIVFSTSFDTFSHKNPHLSVQITRALLMDMKNKCHIN
ncbi:BTB/POZ domain-containing protein At3g56230 [Macadamia integrifolia]|uniref:BTB/POZ domain-containing protein At3g56230 n=1 Tax=Macadamia integrifolia TaxID=60698 RepID=UPI001C50268E|nr:BTB/POZ domain-containing protein At3g56230 [Macadamia integrifolia]